MTEKCGMPRFPMGTKDISTLLTLVMADMLYTSALHGCRVPYLSWGQVSYAAHPTSWPMLPFLLIVLNQVQLYKRQIQ